MQSNWTIPGTTLTARREESRIRYPDINILIG